MRSCCLYPRGDCVKMPYVPSLQQVKNRIRALLLSAKNGCSPRQLLNDYQQFIGEPLPYLELGFEHYMDMLRAMPDAVCIVRSRDKTVLHAVPDSSTQHIARMVSKQKDNSRSGFDGHGHPRMSMIVPSSSNRTTAPVRKATPQVPSSFRVQLRSLLLSYPNGITLVDFSEAFARRFAYYCNFKSWGFATLEDVLRSVRDVITLELDPVRNTLVIKRAQVLSIPKMKSSSGSSCESKVTAGGQKVAAKSAHITIPSKPRPSPSVDSLHSIELSPPKKTMAAVVGESLKRSVQSRKGSVVTKKLVGQVDQLLKANPAGLWVSQFSSEFKEHYKEDLPVVSLGFTSVVHLLSSIPVCKIEKPLGLGDWLAYSTARQETLRVVPDHAFKPEAYVSIDLIESIHRLLKNHQDGLPLTSFTRTYSESLRRDLPLEEIGFSSVAELLQKVPGVMVMKPPGSSEVLVYRTTSLPTEREREESTSSETKLDSSTSSSLYDGSKVTAAYSKLPLPSKSRMCPVYVTHVKTPSYLVVQLLGEKTTKALECLLEDVTQFYRSKEGDGYRMDRTRVGEPCCAMFNNDGYWYRCEVQSIPASDIVEVKYVDYGNTAVVPLSSIRRPKPHYLTLPAQAVECRLANLKPAGSTWSRMATRLLFEMTKDKPMVAIITAIKNGIMSVCLCDTNTEKDIHINDTLVNQGLALFSPDSQEDQTKGFDEYQLESAPVGSTGDKVPDVRLPEDKGQVASAPPPEAHQTPPPLVPSAMPPLQYPTVSQMSQLQVQSYLQQLLLLQQQQNALLLNQTNTNPMFSGSQTGFQAGQTGFQAGQTGFQAGQTGFQAPMGVPPLILNPVYNPLVSQQQKSVYQPPAVVSSQVQQTAATEEQVKVPGATTASAVSVSQDSLSLNSISTDSTSGVDIGSVKAVSISNKIPPISPPPPSPPVRTAESLPPSTLPQRERDNGSVSETVSKATKEERMSSDMSAKKQLIKRVTLTTSHALSVLCHNSRAYFISCEVSEWFWESDLLKSMLRQVQKQVWGLLLMQRKAPKLFSVLRKCPSTARFVEYENQLTVYALEDLPMIVQTFHAPTDLCSAVTREVKRWQTAGVSYFSPDSNIELKELEACLKQLQEKRKEVLTLMMERSGDDLAIGKAPLEQLIDVEKDIANVKNRLSKLEKKSAPPQSSIDNEATATSRQPRQSDMRETSVESNLESESSPIHTTGTKTGSLGGGGGQTLQILSSSDSATSLSTTPAVTVGGRGDGGGAPSVYDGGARREMSVSMPQTDTSSWSSNERISSSPNESEDTREDDIRTNQVQEATEPQSVAQLASHNPHTGGATLPTLGAAAQTPLAAGDGPTHREQKCDDTKLNNDAGVYHPPPSSGGSVHPSHSRSPSSFVAPRFEVPMLQCGSKMLPIDQVVAATSIAARPPQLTLNPTPLVPVTNQFVSSPPQHHQFVPVTHSHAPPLSYPHLPPQGATMVPPLATYSPSSRAVGLGRGISKASGVMEKPRSVGLGRGLSRARRPVPTPAASQHVDYHDDDEGGEWQVVSHNNIQRTYTEIPPMGSGAGLDII